MKYVKVEFQNEQGQQLAGHLELPIDQEPHNYVLFAHCFTCNKNFFAARNISRALANNGFGVLRFDFTGLGESEGDFADTNFSGNVEDLLSAADFLKREHKAPTMIIGHSLGGAAVIFAAKQLPSIKAVATVAAPSSPRHVTHLMKSDLQEIKEQGRARVNLGGRDFTIKEQFLEDLETRHLKKVVHDFDKALLVLHSPQDMTVEIKNAEDIYDAAMHPKSFISLDGADHMLSQKKDSQYAGNVIAAWALRYVEVPLMKQLNSEHQVMANLGREGFTTQMKAGNHFFLADEPVELGGKDLGPDPYEFLAAALAACTSMTLQMYAKRKKWPLENVETHVSHSREHAEDCLHCEDEKARIETFRREIVLQGDLDKEQQEKLLQIADKCPVHRTLESDIKIITGFAQEKIQEKE